MSGILAGMRVVEIAAFIAAPMAGVTLAQMGAEVIRIDPIGGGLDYRRWPVTAGGSSLYWAGLNKGKRSVTLDLRSPAGRELAAALIAAPGADAGIFLTNLSATGLLSYASLRKKRRDLIMLQIAGSPDGAIAVDYTVNSAVGFPGVTGTVGSDEPVNHVLPAWDSLCALAAATAILAAERHRRATGAGQLARIALSDVAMGITGHLGYLSEAEINRVERPAHGNAVYGTFGRDFRTADGRNVMILAVTPRQWDSLVEAMELSADIDALESTRGIDCHREEDRWLARDALFPLVERWTAARGFTDVEAALDRHNVLWGPYRTFAELIASDPRCSTANPMFEEIDQPGIGRHRVPGSPIEFSAVDRLPVRPAPRLGEHTEEVLAEILGLGDSEIRALQARGVASRDCTSV